MKMPLAWFQLAERKCSIHDMALFGYFTNKFLCCNDCGRSLAGFQAGCESKNSIFTRLSRL
jgi:hypothetical protein